MASGRLEGEFSARTSTPTVRLSLVCAASTDDHTAACERSRRMESFKSREAVICSADLKVFMVASSPARRFQRPRSTQNVRTRIRFERRVLCGTMKS